MENQFESFNDIIRAILPIQKHAIEVTLSTAKPRIDNIISGRMNDRSFIEHTFDLLLDHAYDDQILEQYKKLARYCVNIDPELTAFYINSYREIWDTEDL